MERTAVQILRCARRKLGLTSCIGGIAELPWFLDGRCLLSKRLVEEQLVKLVACEHHIVHGQVNSTVTVVTHVFFNILPLSALS